MARQKIAVKKYIVTLSDEERERLTTLIHSGKHPAKKLLKARIRLKADASQGGAGWSDSRIAAALETSVDTVARTRQRLVEEGLEAALTLDIATAGRGGRRTEDRRTRQRQHASGNMGGRTLKKTLSSRI